MNDKTLQPGSRIGMLGGGQLGRMFAHAAQRMGYHVRVLSPEDGPACQVTSDAVCLAMEDPQAIESLAREVDVITLEFENIPLVAIQRAASITPVRPGELVLATSQHRVLEKTTLRDAGFPVTPFRAVDSPEDLRAAAEELGGWELILKTANWGYDGKGQRAVRTEAEADEALLRLGPRNVIAEKRIAFSDEVSVLVARSLHGEVAAYPMIHNTHVRHILDLSVCPAPPRLSALQSDAQEIAVGVAEHLGLIGLLCVEFFVAGEGLMINEIAPRPHNSGHLTIEAAACSQFEQQLRAICGLPLGSTEVRPSAMVNLLGELWNSGTPNWSAVLSDPAASLHLYGKAEPRPGRKMGHLTVRGESPEAAAKRAAELRRALIRDEPRLFATDD